VESKVPSLELASLVLFTGDGGKARYFGDEVGTFRARTHPPVPFLPPKLILFVDDRFRTYGPLTVGFGTGVLGPELIPCLVSHSLDGERFVAPLREALDVLLERFVLPMDGSKAFPGREEKVLGADPLLELLARESHPEGPGSRRWRRNGGLCWSLPIEDGAWVRFLHMENEDESPTAPFRFIERVERIAGRFLYRARVECGSGVFVFLDDFHVSILQPASNREQPWLRGAGD
jgi:hypothetical protein